MNNFVPMLTDVKREKDNFQQEDFVNSPETFIMLRYKELQ